MDDKFEKIIKEHAGEIFGQGAGLPDGHRKRFEQQIKEHKAQCEASVLPADKIMTATSGRFSETAAHELQFDRDIIPGLAGSTIDGRHDAAPVKKWLVAIAATAAVLAGIVFMLNRPENKQHGTELADVRNYYNMQLEEQFEITRQLALNIDGAHRETLLAGIEQIENDPIPDVQAPDDEYIVLIVNVYEKKIETLRNIQNIIEGNI
jgi:hypothetical protein